MFTLASGCVAGLLAGATPIQREQHMNNTNRLAVSATDTGTNGPVDTGPLPTQRRVVLRTAAVLSSFLLATLLSAVILLADRLVDAWFAGGLLVAVLVLWLVLFAGLALFGRLMARLALQLAASLHAAPATAHQQLSVQRQGRAPRAGPEGPADVHAVLARSGHDRLTNWIVLPACYRPW